jgi:hypothetical protein
MVSVTGNLRGHVAMRGFDNHAPKCRHEHRLKQHSGWNVEQITPGTFRWTAPSGRHYDTEPTRYPI